MKSTMKAPYPAYQAMWMMAGKRFAGPATGYSLLGPGAGSVGTPSTNFIVALLPAGGAVAGTVTVTPSDSGGGGTFTPSTMALTTASPSATFTYTAGSAGTKIISTTNNGGLTNPSSISYNASVTPHLLNTLISYWKMDETSAGTVPVTRVDSRGTNNLSDPLNMGSAAGIINNSAYVGVNAIDSYLTIANNASLQVTGDFTFSLWVQIQGSRPTQVIFFKGDTNVPPTEYLFYHDQTGGTGFNFAIGATAAAVGGIAALVTWYHVVCWYDSIDSKVRMRINDATTYVSATTVTLAQAATPLNFGTFNPPQLPFFGLIDEVGFWKRKLTALEITALYNGGTGLPFSSFTA